eukprot:TRINITY_DN4261_c0_g1_i11.p1 TRINITY_DN4261_c0_g1~~TRINITY_DN4261_c0_g1_i11.p1  ORF type:complete len:110 (-),score=9.09 TRINITY_DN4261_c0_g1_i11:41-370(-)
MPFFDLYEFLLHFFDLFFVRLFKLHCIYFCLLLSFFDHLQQLASFLALQLFDVFSVINVFDPLNMFGLKTTKVVFTAKISSALLKFADEVVFDVTKKSDKLFVLLGSFL